MSDGQFSFGKITDVFKHGLAHTALSVPRISPPDKRSRQDVQEDQALELAQINKQSLIDLRECCREIRSDEEWLKHSNDVDNVLTKFINCISDFEKLNAESHRKIELKRAELKLDEWHDWKEKGRTFLFRVLASALFIASLFAIGYIDHEYEWARLPLAGYINPSPKIPK